MEELIEELTKVTPDNLSEEGLKLFNKINEIIDKNKEYEKQLGLDYIGKNYIHKSLILTKIQEIDIEISMCEYADDDSEEYKKDVEHDKRLLLRDKRTLQELLE